MINLSRHIEVLLLRHDCVVVPGFGGFVVQYVPAHYVAEEQVLMPPRRTVNFNAQLTWDDGLVVQSCMQTAGISYPEAVKLVRRAVEELKRTLAAEKSYDFDGIGQLNIGPNGLYEFVPNDAGVASPALYALEVLSSPRCHSLVVRNADGEANYYDVPQSQTEDAAAEVSTERALTRKNYALSLNREVCNYVAAAVVAVVFYFLWVTPIGLNTSDGSTSYAQVFSAPATELRGGQETSGTATAECGYAVNGGQETAAPTSAPTSAPTYTIILVSSVKRSNAEAYVKTLHEAGFDKAEVMAKPHMVRVAYGHYTTEAEAYGTLRKLRADKRFGDAWVMEIK